MTSAARQKVPKQLRSYAYSQHLEEPKSYVLSTRYRASTGELLDNMPDKRNYVREAVEKRLVTDGYKSACTRGDNAKSAKLESAKGDIVKALLLTATPEKLSKVKDKTTRAYIKLLKRLLEKECSLKELAMKTGIKKQLVAKYLDDLTTMGYPIKEYNGMEKTWVLELD